MKIFRADFQLKENKSSPDSLASLRIKGWFPRSGNGDFSDKIRGFGQYDGKNVEIKLSHDSLDNNYLILTIYIEGDVKEWGRFRSQEFLDEEPGILSIFDGREYYLKDAGPLTDKFRLYTKGGRTLAVTTYQMWSPITIYFTLFDQKEEDRDIPLLALVSLMAIFLFNRQKH